MTIVSAGKLTKPETDCGYLKSPKLILAYLKAGCEIKQIGHDRRFFSDKVPEYWLIAPGLAWEIRLLEHHVKALETLDLICLDSGSGNAWYFSKADFSIPSLLELDGNQSTPKLENN